MRYALAGLLLWGGIAQARPNTPGSTDLHHYAAGETVESVDSAGGHFKLFFTRSGADAVPLDDADANGIPDNVDEVSALYEEVLAFYQSLGFRTPISDAATPGDNGGDGRFDVYLLDFAGGADGSFVRETCDAASVCSGYMVQENDFLGYPYPSRTYGNRVLASHEFFHAVQAAYDDSESTIVAEGTAVWATERFDPTLNDFEGFVAGYLTRPDHSLYVPLPGPVSDFSYGSCIFFQFLDEKYGDSTIRELWEASVGPPDWFGSLDGLLATHQSSFAEAFSTFSRWNLFTGKRANPMLGYARGSGYTLVTSEADPAPLTIMSLRIFPAASNYFALPPAGRANMDVSLVPAPGVDSSALRLALSVLRGNMLSDPILADASLRASAATDGADQLFVVVADTAESGESLRPGLCAGDPSEVDACRAQLGAGPADMGTAPPGSGGGCSFASASPNVTPALLVVLLLAGLAWRGRRALGLVAALLLAACPKPGTPCLTPIPSTTLYQVYCDVLNKVLCFSTTQVDI